MWQGTNSQQGAIDILEKLALFEDLKEYSPVFAGTIPIDADLDGKDIDILCEVHDFDRFQVRLRECFETQKNFLVTEKFLQNERSLMCRFENGRFRIEIFAARRGPFAQDSFLHMVAEAKLLEIGGKAANIEIKKLKAAGLKTEPAFAKHFSIKGDPYAEILKLADMTIDQIRDYLKNQ